MVAHRDSFEVAEKSRLSAILRLMKHQRRRVAWAPILITFGAVLWPLVALASSHQFNIDAASPSNLPAGFGNLDVAIPKIFDVAIVIAAIVFVITFLIGGIRYLSNAGNDEHTGKAKKLMVDAIIGLVLTLAAWAIANFVYTQLTGERFGQPVHLGTTGTATSSTSPTGTPGGSTDTRQGKFCLSGSVGCVEFSVSFAEASGKAVPGFRFQVKVTPPSTTLEQLIRPFTAYAAGPTSSAILTADAQGRYALRAPRGATVAILDSQTRVLQTQSVTESFSGLTVQVAGAETRLLKLKFLKSNQLGPVANYQFLIKDQTGQLIGGPRAANGEGAYEDQLPKGEAITVTTLEGAILYSGVVPDDNGRVWTIFLLDSGRVGFRIQILYADYEPAAGKSIEVLLGAQTAGRSYTTNSQGYLGSVTAEVGSAVRARYVVMGGNDQQIDHLNCTFAVPPKNASVIPCLLTFTKDQDPSVIPAPTATQR